MNVYDTANKLAEEIKQSEEFITYQMAKQAINLNFELKSKIEEFETGKDDENKLRHVQELYGELIQNQEASKYFDAEMKFNIMIADVNKIIGNAIQSLIK